MSVLYMLIAAIIVGVLVIRIYLGDEGVGD